jgi:mono/diheme cytochrome c family protein
MGRQTQRPSFNLLMLFFLAAVLVACNESEPEPIGAVDVAVDVDVNATGVRWYSEAQVAAGSRVFAQNCAACHGELAQGLTSDWKQRLDDGSLPPPPLNGSAHAWHHPRSLLLQVINTGGAAFGGNMPAFAGVLDQSEKLAAIAYFQDFWSDENYGQWIQMGGTE